MGIADQMCQLMIASGLTEEQARRCFWLIDRPGLLIDDMDSLVSFQRPYARERAECVEWKCDDLTNITLLDVVRHVKPTVLIGCSTVTGAFTEDIVKSMAEQCERPIIFPLSNPTSKAEATPHDLIHWTAGKAIVAAGSPFPPVKFEQSQVRVAQCNNAFIFPGLGLGVIASKASRVSDAMIVAACEALSEFAPILTDPDAPVLPDFDQVHDVSRAIAVAVAIQAEKEGLAMIEGITDWAHRIEALFWAPEYVPYELV